jgi:hypothetical protein
MNLSDGDYVLTEGAGWFEVSGFVVRIRGTPAALLVDVYKSGEEMEGALNSLFVEVDDAAPNI